MPAHYGAFRGTTGKDLDAVDCYLGSHPLSPHVFVIDQIDHETGKYDEAKCCLCFANEKQALRAYEAGFSDGKGKHRIGRVTAMTIPQFKTWLEHGNTKAPFKHADIPNSEKRTHASVNYVEKSKIAGRKCANCKHFIAPNACEGVQSPIAPSGWCKRYQRS